MAYHGIKFVPSLNSDVDTFRSSKCGENEADVGAIRNGDEVSKFYRELVSEPSKNNNLPHMSKKVFAYKGSSTSTYRKPENIFRNAQEGNIDGIKRCLKENIDVNSLDTFGWSPLMCAACSGCKEAVKILLENGADPNIVDIQGRTFLDIAYQQGHSDILDSFLHSSVVNHQRKITQQFCSLCKINYTENSVHHHASIVHQLNCHHMQKPPFYHLPETNIGFRLLLKGGWNKEHGLGPTGTGYKYPVKTVLKHDRQGLGHGRKKHAKVTHFNPYDTSAVREPFGRFKKRTVKKWEMQKQEDRQKQMEINFRKEFH